MNGKEKSQDYFNRHHDSVFAKGGYWHRDYPYILNAASTLQPVTLVEIGCGSGAFLETAAEKLPNTALTAPGPVRADGTYHTVQTGRPGKHCPW